MTVGAMTHFGYSGQPENGQGHDGGRTCARTSTGDVWKVFASQPGLTVAAWIKVVLLRENGTSLTETVVSAITQGVSAVALCVDDNDEPVVTFCKNTVDEIFVYRRESEVWTAKTSITTSADAETRQTLDIDCDSSGRYAIAHSFYRQSSGLAAILLRTSTDLATYATANVSGTQSGVSSMIEESSRVSIAFDENDDLHLLFSLEKTAGTYHLQYRTWDSSFLISAEDVYTVSNSRPIFFPKHLSMAVSRSAVAFIAFAARSTGFLDRTSIFYDDRSGGTWLGSPEQIHADSNSAADQDRPSIAYSEHQTTRVIAWEGNLDAGRTHRHIYAAWRRATALPMAWIQFEDVEIPGPPPLDSVNPDLVHGHAPHPGSKLMDGAGILTYISGDDVGKFGVDESLSEWRQEPEPRTSVGVSHVATISGLEPSGVGSTVVGVGHAVTKVVETNLGYPRTRIGVSHVAVTDRYRLRMPVGVSHATSLAGSEWNRSGTTTLGVRHFAVRQTPGICQTDYVPSPPVPDDPDSVLKVTFLGPFQSPTRAVQLLRPSFASRRTLDPRVSSVRARAGDIHQKAKAGGADIRHALSFEGMQREKALEFEDFIKAMRGRSVQYVDHDGNTWQVWFLRSPITFRANRRDWDGRVDVEILGKYVT